MTLEDLVTQEVAEEVEMSNPEELPQGAQTTLFSTPWGPIKESRGSEAKVWSPEGGAANFSLEPSEK